MKKRVCLIDGYHPATTLHAEVNPWPFSYSDGYPPVVLSENGTYFDIGQYTDQQPPERLYLKAPFVDERPNDH